jgi:uncharacterized hydantoinase/oxoprolinase family protein
VLSLQEVFDFSGLDEEEIHAIAKHEHVSEVCAAGLGSSLLQTKQGTADIECLMRENIEEAKSHGQPVRAEACERVLAHFKENH